jgi:outer membrane protein TolC
MMPKFLLVLFLAFSIQVKAQSIVETLSGSGFSLMDSTGEKLANLVIPQTPHAMAMDKQIESRLYQWKSSRVAWLNNVTTSFNLNEGNLQKQDTVISNIFYPRYNLHVNIPLGEFFTRPRDAKKARADYQQSKFIKDIEIGRLKELIKKAYQEYQVNKYLLALQESVLQDESVLMTQTEEKFKKNELSLEVFTNASKRYNSELAERLTLMKEVSDSKIELETLLGMSLETAMTLLKEQEDKAREAANK